LHLNLSFCVYLSFHSTNNSFVSTFENNLKDFQCDPDGDFAFVVHGWEESIDSLWPMSLIRKLTYYRGGCVIFMDYSYYAKNPIYFGLTLHFFQLAQLLTRKIRQVTENYDKIFMFGFSMGARLCFEAGAQIGYQKIKEMHMCDPARPAFDNVPRTVDPKSAAKHVYCINTSVNKGTNIYNCHINFRMGVCGKRQIGASKKPFGSHGLCVIIKTLSYLIT
jgi:hypothetical protein